MLCSFIIGFHTQRKNNLIQTVRFLELLHPEIVAESQLILVCQDSCDPINNNFKKYDHFNLNLTCMHLPYVTNYGVDHTESEKLIILESDRILPKGYFRTVIDQLKPGVQISTQDMVRPQIPITDKQAELCVEKIQLFRQFPRAIEDLGFPVKHEWRTKENQIGMRNMWSGNTALMKSDFNKVGRMDEAYRGYGWADTDMTNTMERAGIASVFRPEIEIHLWHAPATYATINDSHMFVNNGFYFCRKWNVEPPDWLLQERAKHAKLML